ncbi:DUF1304 family protein [Labrys sp. ZIDIC5]|uniref:DUF1304 family protein n=1 Tax=Labrys sedimenti TaxID=3106036 RepID=UPI002ACACE70|nr:DUF1304 family protein [Labrys sp. ZIDIC5]MDZ5450512.1 DUF1304 family protein [Labrys sp. ZIDIC5]
MRKSVTLFASVVTVTYFAFFLVEAVLWMWPPVHNFLLPQLNSGLDYPVSEQALILRTLFVNQGVYNLMLGLAGIAGLILVARGKVEPGLTLIKFACLFALGAAGILLTTTSAYVLGIVQALFPMFALFFIWCVRDRTQQQV